MEQEKIGKFIAELRKEKKLTQGKLAEMLGVSTNAVSKLKGNMLNGYVIIKTIK